MQTLAVPRWLPLLLAFVAGTIDACTFLALFGLFVAQVTGSFVLVGVTAMTGHSAIIARLLAIPVFFLVGVATVFIAVPLRRPARAFAVTLAVELMLVVCFALLGFAGEPFRSADAPLAVAASLFGVAAMGVQSALVRLLMSGSHSTNVMTTNTSQAAVDVGQWIIAFARGEDRADANRKLAALIPILAGFFIGTLAGAFGLRWIGFRFLAVPVLLLAGAIAWAARTGWKS
ncbi:MAG TPA: YoaK family protein [Pseudolabrys sp.]|nr:YoaK family protein [Pseudolabrys sp.]